jgi:hypothetical protein
VSPRRRRGPERRVAPAEELRRVDVGERLAHASSAEVHRAGAGVADALAAADPLTAGDLDVAELDERRGESAAPDRHAAPAGRDAAGEGDDAGARRSHRLAGPRVEVDSAVAAAREGRRGVVVERLYDAAANRTGPVSGEGRRRPGEEEEDDEDERHAPHPP